jgi:hypothetical protein
MKIKKSIIYSILDEEFVKLVSSSKRMKDISDFFGVKNVGGISKNIQNRIKELSLDTSHIMSRTESSVFARKITKERFLTEFLVENCQKDRQSIKLNIIKFNLIEQCCKKCKNSGNWMGTSLVLQLEHKNGVNNDNRIENLCFLCPNCHSQTDTFGGKNKFQEGRNYKTKNFSDEQIKETIPIVTSKSHLDCYLGISYDRNFHIRVKKIMKENPLIRFKENSKMKKTKAIWPSPFEMQKLLFEKTTVSISKDLGVSDSAIGKFCKKHSLNKPPRGYWQKLNSNVASGGNAPHVNFPSV